MPKLVWDKTGERLYETGVSKGALFVRDSSGLPQEGVAWNGLIGVTESPEGGEETPKYEKKKKYLSLTSAEELNGTITAFTYPDEFAECDGSKPIAPGVYAGQQARRTFDLAYCTEIGNDTVGSHHGQKLHLIYAAKVSPSSRENTTINDTPEAVEFSWDFTTTAQEVEADGFQSTSKLTISSLEVDPETWTALNDLVYGTEEAPAEMPSIDEVIALVTAP